MFDCCGQGLSSEVVLFYKNQFEESQKKANKNKEEGELLRKMKEQATTTVQMLKNLKGLGDMRGRETLEENIRFTTKFYNEYMAS